MPLTTSFKERVLQRANTDLKFVVAMLGEAIQALVADDINIGSSLLRNCTNATVGFSDLAKATGIPANLHYSQGARIIFSFCLYKLCIRSDFSTARARKCGAGSEGG